MSTLLRLAVAAAGFFAGVSASNTVLDPIIIKGNKFFNAKTRKRFMMTGVTYGYETSADAADQWKPAIDAIAAISPEVNTIRLYRVHPSVSASKYRADNGLEDLKATCEALAQSFCSGGCYFDTEKNVCKSYDGGFEHTSDYDMFMNYAASKGLYVVVPLTPAGDDPWKYCTLNREGTTELGQSTCYPSCLLSFAEAVMKSFGHHTNTIAYVIGNEVVDAITDKHSMIAGQCIKAFTRDVKNHMLKCDGLRLVPTVYAAADRPMRSGADVEIVPNEANGKKKDFLSCGPWVDRVDVFGLNIYRWCNSGDSFGSVYKGMSEGLTKSGGNVPLLLTEYGCAIGGPMALGRAWDMVPSLYGPDMNEHWSGGTAYAYGRTGGPEFAMFLHTDPAQSDKSSCTTCPTPGYSCLENKYCVDNNREKDANPGYVKKCENDQDESTCQSNRYGTKLNFALSIDNFVPNINYCSEADKAACKSKCSTDAGVTGVGGWCDPISGQCVYDVVNGGRGKCQYMPDEPAVKPVPPTIDEIWEELPAGDLCDVSARKDAQTTWGDEPPACPSDFAPFVTLDKDSLVPLEVQRWRAPGYVGVSCPAATLSDLDKKIKSCYLPLTEGRPCQSHSWCTTCPLKTDYPGYPDCAASIKWLSDNMNPGVPTWYNWTANGVSPVYAEKGADGTMCGFQKALAASGTCPPPNERMTCVLTAQKANVCQCAENGCTTTKNPTVVETDKLTVTFTMGDHACYTVNMETPECGAESCAAGTLIPATTTGSVDVPISGSGTFKVIACNAQFGSSQIVSKTFSGSGTGTPTVPPSTRVPTNAPTGTPTSAPTAAPTTALPTSSPTSRSPTRFGETHGPTTAPSAAPTDAPTDAPTAAPTPQVTTSPGDTTTQSSETTTSSPGEGGSTTSGAGGSTTSGAGGSNTTAATVSASASLRPLVTPLVFTALALVLASLA